ncbi:MAG: hypothetical protein NVSMB9_34720 [Isosphaeraceae bacterium]
MRLWPCLLAGCCLFAGNAPEAPVDNSQATLQLLVPAYFYPAGEGDKYWERLFSSPARQNTVAIVNPASGPGDKVDPNYTSVLARAKTAEVTLIGYVHTSYAKRPIADVKADVDTWLKLYPGIQGIFFDEQASDPKNVDYQAELYQYVHDTKNLDLVITNPGTVCDQEYLSRPALDACCLFEGMKKADSLDFPPWTDQYKPDHVAALGYNVTTADEMNKCINDAVDRKIGYLYITDAGGTNPWDRLPLYWDEEAAAVARLNARDDK